eukprot:GHRR01003311.1.p1 GENE.GHRR01003311.1~~GHRR01003311.1.p1  ORF type:complete len:263 (+),score=91.78 GHRR01003311.1:594-1382(+)
MEQSDGDVSANPAAPWALLGRDTAAGRALFSLYNGDNMHGRVTGLRYSQRNRQKIQQQAAARVSHPVTDVKQEQPIAKSKPKVAVPRFRGHGAHSPTSPSNGVNKLSQIPRRKQGHQILAELAAEAQQQLGRAPLPSGPLIDEKEKERCALMMQYKGKIPASAQLDPSKAAATRRSLNRSGLLGQQQAVCDGLNSRRRQIQQRFTEIEGEIAEREEFMVNMQQRGKLTEQHLSILRGEVAVKVQEMRQLDKQIKDLDSQARQ